MMLAVCFVKCEICCVRERERVFTHTHTHTYENGKCVFREKVAGVSFFAVACFARIYLVCY